MTSQKKCDCPDNVGACVCRPEEEHGLQASAAKQRIDAQCCGSCPGGCVAQARSVPPAVAEFAVGERDQLLARVAELEAERDRLKRSAQANWNEFAEGLKHPSAGVDELPDPYGWVAAGRSFTDRDAAIAAAEKTPCVDVYSRPQMDVVVDRSLQRQGVAEELARQLKASGAEIRGMRAQLAAPAGLVLPERKPANFHWNECIEEVKRLNSSPGSAAQEGLKTAESHVVLGVDGAARGGAGGVLPDRDGLVAAVCVLKSQGLGNLAAAVSDALAVLDGATIKQSLTVGVVDERAAFEAWYETTYGISLEPEFRANHFIGYVNDKANHRWTAWQARAALSAPSHGEQARETLGMAIDLIQDLRKDTAVERRLRELYATFAPSAGSQGGDV